MEFDYGETVVTRTERFCLEKKQLEGSGCGLCSLRTFPYAQPIYIQTTEKSSDTVLLQLNEFPIILFQHLIVHKSLVVFSMHVHSVMIIVLCRYYFVIPLASESPARTAHV
jgi:hypothetical protein